MTVQIRPAALDDLHLICRLRQQRASWLAARGSDQWSTEASGLSIDYFARVVDRALAAGETWIAEVRGEPAGTITVNERADKELWTDAELAESLIVHYLIVDLRYSGHGVGRKLLAHAAALTRTQGRSWVRLDAWTTNTDLHAYYRRAGFRLARVAGPDRPSPSCALFERHIDEWRTDDALISARPASFPMTPLSPFPAVLPALG
ncbi:GNAT family N-acetyltransferase [Nocardia carnea]|uniref:GNAT family N-acetyltransferase n=1 Tax=Nocardia carnea TaxID=37328 RepID=UPI002453DBE8|nr:GNAT family N-acetyltransferase [Nocardia carnea]